MKVPYVIDNRECYLGDVLEYLLKSHQDKSLDVATAYLTIGGIGMLLEGLRDLGNFRLLLGAEPHSGEQLGLRPGSGILKKSIRSDLELIPFDEKTLRLVEDTIAFLRREDVRVRLYKKGFLHAKCWLFYSDAPESQGLLDRFRPLLAIVGSSNFTRPGFTSNLELNLVHKVLLQESESNDPEAASTVAWLANEQPGQELTADSRRLIKSEVGARAIIDLEQWYENQWNEAVDFKDELIELLDASKFGTKEYTPYQVYMKALYEYFRDDLDRDMPAPTRSAVELAEFQESAVKKARKILARYDGVMVADSVGLGKTWIGKKLLEDFAYHMRQKAVVICPAGLRPMWETELATAAIAATVLSQEELGREEFDPSPWVDADVILLDESHNFRNRNAQRYGNIERILSANGGRGRDGCRKKVILLTATPINNDLFDLYNQLSLITQGDRSYFAACGIGDLYRYFLRARREFRTKSGAFVLFNLLEEIVIRRTRSFIRTAYPEALIKGERIHFPNRKLRTVKYDLERTYEGIYDEVVKGIEGLKLPPYNLENYKKAGVDVDEFEAGRGTALVGIFKSRYLKRFESSIEAFRISVSRALTFIKTFESYILDGRVLRSSDFRKTLRYISTEDDEDDVTRSLADEIDASDEAHTILDEMESVNPADYDLRRLHSAVQHDIDVLTKIWNKVKDIDPDKDAKLVRFKELLRGELRGKKVLVFSYYKDTARYLYKHLGHPDNPAALEFCDQLGGVTMRRMDSGTQPKDRTHVIQCFAPVANNKPEWAGTDREIDIMISTDVLSEGQNLQDCGYLVNYDLHWNPTRMVQRAGRIDRIGTRFDTLWIYNMFPDEGLEKLLRLVESLMRKIDDINRAGFLDASVLGETVNPQNFNALRKICEEDGPIIEEEEQFAELAGSEFILRQLRELLEAGGLDMLESLPHGIHSGLAKAGARGAFFYFQAEEPGAGIHHYWRYYDIKNNTILDNRYLIANLIACSPETVRYVQPEIIGSIFDIQEKIIHDILRSSQAQKALEIAPRPIDPIQQTLSTAVQGYMNHPDIQRSRAISVIQFLNQPMADIQVKDLRALWKEFQASGNIKELLVKIEDLRDTFGVKETVTDDNQQDVPWIPTREDLRLICFDVVAGA